MSHADAPGAIYDEPSCQRCGSSMEWVTCDTCGGEGVDGHDCGDDTCCCLYPEENIVCDICDGEGGWWRCWNYRTCRETEAAS